MGNTAVVLAGISRQIYSGNLSSSLLASEAAQKTFLPVMKIK